MKTYHFNSFDGVELAWTETGSGRPVILLHGLFSNAQTNWIKFGTAATIAAAGFRVIMPDLRGHGLSTAPHGDASYPADVLALDAASLVEHLELSDYDLGGYSLGARTTMRCLIRGMTPRRAVIAGMGLSGLVDFGKRTDWFLHVIADAETFERGSDGWTAVQFMKTNQVDGVAISHLLRSQVSMTADEIAAVATPLLAVAGKDDDDNGSAAELATAVVDGRYVEVGGNHMSAVVGPDFGEAIATFLAA